MVKLVVSVAQACTHRYELEPTLEKMDRLVRQAKERDRSQVIVFPEAFIGGYPKFSSFGAVVGTRSAAGRDEFLAYHNAAICVPGLATDRVAQIAREHGVFIVSGLIEKDGGTLYCSVGFWSPANGLVYKRRKLMPTASERLIWGFGDESTLSVVKVPLGCSSETALASAGVCWENLMPLLRQHFYNQGTQLYCAPTVDGREGWLASMRHIAMEGRCFVLSACQFAQQKDYNEGHAIDGEVDPEGVMIAGGSVIISPFGDVLAGPLRGSEGVLSAEIDLDDIVRAKFDLDVAGHYSRPDVFQLSVRGQ